MGASRSHLFLSVLGFAAALELASPTSAANAQGPAATEAMAAYRHLVGEPSGDEERYLASFTPSLECFYGRRHVPRARLRSRLLYPPASIAELHVVEERPGVVTLVDRGWYGGDGRLAFHEKVVRLRRIQGRWLVSGETGARSRGCLTELLQRAPARSWRLSYCQRAVRPFVRRMVRRCNEPDDVHGCALYSEEAHGAIRECFFGRTIDLATAPTGVTRTRDVPWSRLTYFYRTAWASEDHAFFRGVVFRDVDGDGHEDAIVTLGLRDNPPVHAYALRRGHIVELGEVVDPTDERCAGRVRPPGIVCGR